MNEWLFIELHAQLVPFKPLSLRKKTFIFLSWKQINSINYLFRFFSCCIDTKRNCIRKGWFFGSKNKEIDLRLLTVPTRCEWGISFTVPLTCIYFSTPVPEVLPENLVEPEPEPGQPSKQSSVLVQPSSTLTQVLILVHSLY